MKLPGRVHPITIVPTPGRVIVRLGGMVIAETTEAMTLREGTMAPVHYIPRADVNMLLLERSARVTSCPFKGEASYFTIVAGGKRAADSVWSYEHPYPAVAAIAWRLAFYPERVDRIEILPS